MHGLRSSTLQLFPLALLAAATLCFGLVSSEVKAAVYHVSPAGNDENDGSSASQAFRTIKKAAQAVASGDSVYVAAGTYTDDITLDGIQQSTAPTQFIASSGSVVTARWKVLNSNYITLDGFTFQGPAHRFLVWEGSFEGTLQNCVFDGATEGLLIKSGSLTLDNCQIENSARDGLQIDGESRVILQDATITGCQEAGVEIRKDAHVVVTNCTITANQGNGVEVAVTLDTLDEDPALPSFGREYLLAGLDKFDMSGGWVKGYNSESGPSSIGDTGVAASNGNIQLSGSAQIYGDAYTQGSVDPARVSGAVHHLDDPLSAEPVNFGSTPTHNDNAILPLSDHGEDVLDPGLIFQLSGGDGIDLPPGTYYFNQMTLSGSSSIRVSGSTIIYCTGSVDLSGGSVANSTQNPANFQIRATGDVKLSASSTLYAAVYAPEHKVDLSGSSSLYGMAVGQEIKLSSSGGIVVDEALVPLAGRLVGGLFGSATSSAAPTSWTPVNNGELAITNTELTSNLNGVRLVTEQPLTASASEFSGNTEWGLKSWGPLSLDSCTISDNSVGGVWLKQVMNPDVQVNNNTLADNDQYGVYAESCELTFDSGNIGGWAISGGQYAIVGDACDFTFSGVTIQGGSLAVVCCFQGNLFASHSTFTGSDRGVEACSNDQVQFDTCNFSGNEVGLVANFNTNLTATGSTFASNSVWGAVVQVGGDASRTATFSTCSFHDNAGGLSLDGGVNGSLLLRSGTVIRDNTSTGLHLTNCDFTLDDQSGGTNWSLLRNYYGISCTSSQLAIVAASITDCTSYAIHATTSSLTVSNSNLTGGNGIFAANNAASTIDSSRLTSTGAPAGYGIYRQEGDLLVRNCVINGFDHGVYLETAGTPAAVLVNDTIANTGVCAIQVASGPAELVNTILCGTSGQYGIADGGGQLAHAHNLIHGFSTPLHGTAAGAGEILDQPGFVDPAAGDFHLAAGSKAINSGTDRSADVPADLEGASRPSHGAFEMGAYEYVPDHGSFRVLDWSESD